MNAIVSNKQPIQFILVQLGQSNTIATQVSNWLNQVMAVKLRILIYALL